MTVPTGPGSACDAELLAMFGAGELDAVRRAQVTEHLVDCDRCWSSQSAQRLAAGAVQQLWEAAPAGLRADILAAVTAEARSRPRPVTRMPRRRHLVGIAAGLVLLGGGGLAATQLTGSGGHALSAAHSSIPASVQAAIEQATSRPTTDSRVAPAPTLSELGLKLTASGSTEAPGVHAAQYTYVDRAGRSLTVFVAAQAWPRPRSATNVSGTAWSIDPNTQTVVGGADLAGDNMLVVATDHDAAVTAAVALGLVRG